MLGNVKTAITGTYHKLDPKHLGRYLSEFNYRFNRRFDIDLKAWAGGSQLQHRCRIDCSSYQASSGNRASH